jgi:glutathione S-transferase
MLQLKDGTRLTQTKAILSYLGELYRLKPTHALACYRGERAVEYMWDEYIQKTKAQKGFVLPISVLTELDPEDTSVENIAALLDKHLPNFLKTFNDNCLTEGSPYLCGDQISVYDLRIASFFFDFMLNKGSEVAVNTMEIYRDKSPERLKSYVSRLYDRIKPYLM